MKILFAAWRYHPNYDGMIAGLTRAGHSVAFLAHFTHPTEKYADGVELCIVERSAQDSSESLRGRRPQWDRRIAPSFTFLYNYLRTNRPDLVIARDYSRTNYTIFLICQLLGIKYLHYTQMRPGYEPVSWLRRRLLRLGLWPRHTLKTVVEVPSQDIPGKTYDFIPFAVDTYQFRKENYPAHPPIRILTVGKLDAERKHRLLNGLDDIGLTLEKAAAIDAFEARQVRETPWLKAG
jgi:hypothetical protein